MFQICEFLVAYRRVVMVDEIFSKLSFGIFYLSLFTEFYIKLTTKRIYSSQKYKIPLFSLWHIGVFCRVKLVISSVTTIVDIFVKRVGLECKGVLFVLFGVGFFLNVITKFNILLVLFYLNAYYNSIGWLDSNFT